MSRTQTSLTVIFLDENATLEVNQEYRVVAPGLELTVPTCQPDEYIVIEPLVDQRAAATKLLALSATIDGANTQVDLSTNARTLLRCSIADAWLKI